MTSRIWHIFLFLLLADISFAAKKDSTEVLPDSSNFVTASYLVASPTSETFSVFGHAAIRMECPSENLDFVFSFESDPEVSGFTTFISGNANAKYVISPTKDFTEKMRLLNRQLVQYEINLTPQEEKELWRLLDNAHMEGEAYKFNMIDVNCVSMTLLKIHQCLINEKIVWNNPDNYVASMDNGKFISRYARRSQWTIFLINSIAGIKYGDKYDLETRLCPENVIENMLMANFVNDKTGAKRPVLTGKTKELLPMPKHVEEEKITPVMLFGGLLILVILFTALERVFKWKTAPKVLDITLLIIQSVTGAILLYIMATTKIPDLTWNWYLIPFNPLPLLLWLTMRKKKFYNKLYTAYFYILIAFIFLMPLTPQNSLAHLFIAAILAVRCINKVITLRKEGKGK